ncbi:MAG: hypothetical protein RLP44_08970 [Aggregatilineales bacterium]
MDTREILLAARDLIQAKRYQDAYELLQPLDHPVAEQWKAKIRMILAKQRREKRSTTPNAQPLPPTGTASAPKLPAGKPWNPHGLSIWHFFISVFVVGTLLGWNWRRLGRPQWIIPTIAFSIITPILMIGSILYFADQFGLASQISFPTVPMLIIVGLLFLNLEGVYWVVYIQAQGYNKWEKYGVEAMLNHRYTIGKETAIAVAIWVVCVGGLTFYLSQESQLNTFSNARYSVTYPNGWDSYTMADVEFCQQATFYSCDFFLYDNFSAMSLLVISYPLNVSYSSAELEEWAWTNSAPVDYGGAFDRSVAYDIANGHNFTYRRYRAPNHSNPSEILFFQHIYVIEDNMAVEFIVSRPYRICATCDSYDDLEFIYRSIEFVVRPDA